MKLTKISTSKLAGAQLFRMHEKDIIVQADKAVQFCNWKHSSTYVFIVNIYDLYEILCHFITWLVKSLCLLAFDMLGSKADWVHNLPMLLLALVSVKSWGLFFSFNLCFWTWQYTVNQGGSTLCYLRVTLLGVGSSPCCFSIYVLRGRRSTFARKVKKHRLSLIEKAVFSFCR